MNVLGSHERPRSVVTNVTRISCGSLDHPRRDVAGAGRMNIHGGL